MFLLVNKFKMMGMLLNVVHRRLKKANRNITKKSNGFYNHFNILTMKTHNNPNMTITFNIPSQFLPIYPTAHVHS